MPNPRIYEIVVQRSNAAQDQVAGITCGELNASGVVTVYTKDQAFEVASGMCVIPGKYIVTVTAPGGTRYQREVVVTSKTAG